MDSQKLSQLDPKLKVAYDRVMGVNIPESQAPVPPQAPTPIPPPQPSQSIPMHQPVIPPQSTAPIPPIVQGSEFVVPFQGQLVEEKKESKKLLILFLLIFILLAIITAYGLSGMGIIPYKLPLIP